MELQCFVSECKEIPLYSCNCMGTTAYICEIHYEPHLQAQGNHQLAALFKILEDSEINDLKKKIEASENYLIQLKNTLDSIFNEIKSLIDLKIQSIAELLTSPTNLISRSKSSVTGRRYILINDLDFFTTLVEFNPVEIKEKYFSTITSTLSSFTDEIFERSKIYLNFKDNSSKVSHISETGANKIWSPEKNMVLSVNSTKLMGPSQNLTPKPLNLPWFTPAIVDAKTFICCRCFTSISNCTVHPIFNAGSNSSKTLEIREIKPIQINELIIFAICKCVICKNCLFSHAKIYWKNYSAFPLKCPNCVQLISLPQLQYFIPPQIRKIFFSLSKILISCPEVVEKNYQRVECPLCRTVIWIYENQLEVPCSNTACRYIFCRKCKDPYHENSSCYYKERIEHFKILETITNLHMVSQCPACASPYGVMYANSMKNFAFTCTYRYCHTQFCFSCSAFLEPILVHGNQYHRPECTFFEESKKKDKFKQKEFFFLHKTIV